MDIPAKTVAEDCLAAREHHLESLRRWRGFIEEDRHAVHPAGLAPVDQNVVVDNLIIDKERYLVLKDGQEIFLPKKEFELLALLTSKPQKVFTREEIFEQVWGNDVIVGDRTIDVHVRKIREKIGLENIRTIKGVGYKYEV